MSKQRQDEYKCPLEVTMEIIGGKYKGVIIGHLIDKTLRYNELQKLISHATPKMLIQQLKELEADGIIQRKLYPVVPPKTEYSLTERGKRLIPSIIELNKWGLAYLKEMNIKVAYLHSEIKTLERLKIIKDLREGKYDCVVGINLLREGLDIPEVSLIAILDADKEGFLRSERSLIQTIGRCARNANGHVIMYADRITDSMKIAIEETKRRRKIQEEYNKKHGIIPKTIIKDIKSVITNEDEKELEKIAKTKKSDIINIESVEKLEEEMKQAAKNLDFERAMELRDILLELKVK